MRTYLLPGCVAVLLLLGVVQAAELRLVQTNHVLGAGRLIHFEPFISSQGPATGFVACDQSNSTIRIERFDNASLSRNIQLPGVPYDVTHYFSGDSLVVYAAYHTMYNLRVGRFVLVGDTVVQNDIPVQYVNQGEDWWYFGGMEYISIRLDSANMASPQAVILEWYWTFSYYDVTQGSEDQTKAHSMVISLDLSQTIHLGLEKFLLPGDYRSGQGREIIGIGALAGNGQYCDLWDCRSWDYKRNWVWLLENDDDTVFSEYHDTSVVHSAVSGDLTDALPGDEVVIAGYRMGLDSQFISGQNFVAAYSFATGVPQEIWRKQPMNGQVTYAPLCLWEGVQFLILQPVSSPRSILVWHSDTGEKFDSIYFNGPMIPRDFFASDDVWVGFYIFGGAGDSTYLYWYDFVVDVDDEQPDLPSSFTLSQNYPNPFNATTEIRFSLARAAEVTLTVYNLLGQEARTLINGKISAGEHRVAWDGTDASGKPCATGVYLYQIQTADASQSRKMLLLK